MLDTAPPPATRDQLPADAAMRRRLDAAFARTAEAYGFVEVETPMFERADLFAARSGPEIRDALLTFHLDHQEYALRPELTAPVCRMVASGAMAEGPRPWKLFYVGPCFRYCRPHSGRSRQFTQAGLEVLGDESPQADAEVMAAACRFLRQIGISDLQLTIGTAGIVRALLPEALSADDRATVVGQLDRIAGIAERCAAAGAQPDDLLIEQLRMDRRALAAQQAQGGYEGAHRIADTPAPTPAQLLSLLPDEAAATYRRLWTVQGYLPEDIADLLIDATRIRGSLEHVAERAATVLGGSKADKPLAYLMEVCRLVEQCGLEGFEVSLGIARGLTFYTGTVFEISNVRGKLCGGGRYDRLVELFGGDPTPATGCALRFDTLRRAMPAMAETSADTGIRLTAADPADGVRTLRLAEQLRDLGVNVGASGSQCATVRDDMVHLADGSQVAADPKAILQAVSQSFEEVR